LYSSLHIRLQPRAKNGDKGIAAVLFRKFFAVVKIRSVGRGMSFEKRYSRDRILAARNILFSPAIWVAIVSTLGDVIQFLERILHAQVVAAVVGGK
jgi:hypothetical protein